MIGAHYDHVGHAAATSAPATTSATARPTTRPASPPCSQVVRAFAYAPEPPRRSIIFAFWDREEDGLRRLRVLHAEPADPARGDGRVRQPRHPGCEPAAEPAQLQLRRRRRDGRARACSRSCTTRSRPDRSGRASSASIFGQGRSDHVNFINVGVPTVFFSDATGPCYHTDSDDVAVVDFDKLDQQIGILQRLDAITRDARTCCRCSRAARRWRRTTTPSCCATRSMRLQVDLALFTPTVAAQLVAVPRSAARDRRRRPWRLRVCAGQSSGFSCNLDGERLRLRAVQRVPRLTRAAVTMLCGPSQPVHGSL